MPRFYPRRTRNETPEQQRAREEREEIQNARIRAMANRSLSNWKRDKHEDQQLAQGTREAAQAKAA